MRIGIGRNERGRSVDHVLGSFTKEEKEHLPECIEKSVASLKRLVCEDVHQVQADVNKMKLKDEEE